MGPGKMMRHSVLGVPLNFLVLPFLSSLGPVVPWFRVPSLRQIKDAQRAHAGVFLFEYLFQVEVQQTAQGGKIEERRANLSLDDLTTLVTHLSRQVGGHELLQFSEADISGELLPDGIDGDAPASGDGLRHRPVDARGSFAELTLDVEDTAVPEQVFRNGILELRFVGVLHHAPLALCRPRPASAGRVIYTPDLRDESVSLYVSPQINVKESSASCALRRVESGIVEGVKYLKV